MKHGLAGAGIALPTEDEAEVARRFAGFEAELKPQGEVARVLVRRAALHSIRMERCARHEAAMLSEASRHAGAAFDEARAAEVAGLVDRLAKEPEATARQLRTTPEGIAWMLARWETLRGKLRDPRPNRWTMEHARYVEDLIGRRRDELAMARATALSYAALGTFDWLHPSDGAGLEPEARRAWARQELDALLGAEIDGLRRALAAIDPEDEARDRAEAADRALFDASTKATLARRYEAAAERGLYRALREFKELAPAEVEVEAVVEPEPLGSSRADPEAAPTPTPGPVADRPVPIAAAPLGSIGSHTGRPALRVGAVPRTGVGPVIGSPCG